MKSEWNFPIHLASASPRRREILTSMNLAFKVVPSSYRERCSRKTPPEILSMRHALGKAQRAILGAKARFVLGGDTIVWHQGRCLGKPKTRAKALRMLRSLQGKKHSVYTGLALMDRSTNRAILGYSKTDVWVRRLSASELKEYADSIDPFDKAGAYAIQSGIKIVKKIRGSYSNVVGLPKELLRKMLKRMSALVQSRERSPRGVLKKKERIA